MDENLRGYGESLLIIFVTVAINVFIGLILWALFVLVLKQFGVENMLWPGFISALIIAGVLLILNAYSYDKYTRKIKKQEEAPRALFEMFEKSEYESILRSLSNSPSFRISHYMVITLIFLVATLLLIIFSVPGGRYHLRNGWLLAPVFVVFVVWLWYSRLRSMKLTAAFYTGNNLIAKGRAQDALHIARTMLKIRPNAVGGNWLTGNALFALRDYDRASQAYERAIQRNPASSRYLLSFLALCFQRLGLYQRALRTYEDALRLNPGAKEVHYGLACNYSLMNDPGHALPHLQRAVDLGYVDLDYIERDPDIDNIRNEPRFKELAAEMSKS